MKIKLTIACLLIFAFAFVYFQSTTVEADHQWGSYHWARTANPFTLQLGNNLDSKWIPAFNESLDDWSASTVLNVIQVPGQTRPRQCKITNGRVEVCNDRYGNTGWLGVAGISAQGDHITGSYVKLNDTYYDTPTYDTPAWRNFVMCQEIGHAFGLDHQDEGFNNPNLGTCMDYTNNPGTNQHPNNHDYQQLVEMYSHLDSFTTVGDGDGGGDPKPCRGKKCNNAEVDLTSPRQWGQVIQRDDQGRAILYMRDLGNGKKHFTHIFPVPGSKRGGGNNHDDDH